MLAQIISLVVLIALVLIMVILFAYPLLELIINAIVLYFISLRSFTEIKKFPTRLNAYIYSGVVSLALVLLGFKVPLFWDFTAFFLLTFILAQAYLFAKKKKLF